MWSKSYLFIVCSFFNIFYWGNMTLKHHVFYIYNIIFLLLYTIWEAHHQKFSFHSSLHNWFPLTISPSPHPFPYSTNTLFFVSMCFFSFDLFINILFVYIAHLNEIMGHFSLSDLLFIYVYKRYYTVVFFSCNVFFWFWSYSNAGLTE